MSFTPDDYLNALENFECEYGEAPRYVYCNSATFCWLRAIFERNIEVSDWLPRTYFDTRHRLFGTEIIRDESLRDEVVVFKAERKFRVQYTHSGYVYPLYFDNETMEIKREFDLGELNLDNMKPLPMDKLSDLLFGA